jgi:hypothetical protein
MSSTRSVASMCKSGIGGLVLLGLLMVTASCEDKAIGRQCDLQADAGDNQPTYNSTALECPSNLCVKPAKDQSVPATDTAAFCTAACSNDSDCDSGQSRGGTLTDKRCKTGFVCGVALETGPLCCKKLCLCKDFVKLPLETPASCNKAVNSTCGNL